MVNDEPVRIAMSTRGALRKGDFTSEQSLSNAVWSSRTRPGRRAFDSQHGWSAILINDVSRTATEDANEVKSSPFTNTKITVSHQRSDRWLREYNHALRFLKSMRAQKKSHVQYISLASPKSPCFQIADELPDLFFFTHILIALVITYSGLFFVLLGGHSQGQLGLHVILLICNRSHQATSSGSRWHSWLTPLL